MILYLRVERSNVWVALLVSSLSIAKILMIPGIKEVL
ncbi:hypothetical protein SAMN05444380_12648 [Thermophagus xiamenensis]|uniref:Uncharacterized protein n=1 Tax=Thermophagus xiamenensis TaxID=385682 RepID=A0A1I2F5A2_9BACT|nr:hypothetical protein SAMN05444380_12648 [Thermophagus xiamenensis]